ncbi:TetR family transcriptional regulator [Isoptericola hypogeus]|uniref:TetR family transcriptional regulator n=1 Tax=Isoptericola hypogeus TaxID=300179 RepID=A0ABP4VK27_9MICO
MPEPAGHGPEGAPARRARRTDPERRDRIIDACLDVIVTAGVSGTSHRRVARAADVPLGSMTYHFTGMDELLREAFARYARTVGDRFEQRLTAARDAHEAKQAVVAIITSDVATTTRDVVLTHELYTLAAREPAFRDITNAWMARSRRELERHFDPTTARLVDALIEGLTIHRALDTPQEAPRHDVALVTAAVERITRG